MAIIKPIQWKGFEPYWWECTGINYDPINNTTQVYYRCYPDSDAAVKNKQANIISDIMYQTILPGKVTDSTDIEQQVLSKEANGFFYDGVGTDGNYILKNKDSDIIVDISADPEYGIMPGCERKAECLSYKFLMRNDILLMKLNIRFYPNGEYDSTMDKEITWVVDDYYEVSPGVGEFTHFNNSRKNNRLLDEEIISAGILYGDQTNKINVKLYGNH